MVGISVPWSGRKSGVPPTRRAERWHCSRPPTASAALPPLAAAHRGRSASAEQERSIPLALQGHHVSKGDDHATPDRWARRAACPRPPHGAARRRGAAGGESVTRRDSRADSLRPVGSAAGFEGENLRIASRWAEDNVARLPALAAELVRRKVDLIVTRGSIFVQGAQQATASIPIVFTMHADPLRTGHVGT